MKRLLTSAVVLYTRSAVVYTAEVQKPTQLEGWEVFSTESDALTFVNSLLEQGVDANAISIVLPSPEGTYTYSVADFKREINGDYVQHVNRLTISTQHHTTYIEWC